MDVDAPRHLVVLQRARADAAELGRVELSPRFRGDVGDHGHAQETVLDANHRRLADPGGIDQDLLDLPRRDLLAPRLDHVVSPPHEPQMSIVIEAE